MTEILQNADEHHPILPPDRPLGGYLENWADQTPGKLAISLPGFNTSWTYSSLLTDAQTVAAGLKSLGLQQGDQLAIMLPNSPEYVLSWFASLLSGCVDVAINYGLREDILRHALGLSGARIIVCNEETHAAVAAIAPSLPWLETVVIAGSGTIPAGNGYRTVRFEELTNSGEAYVRNTIDPYETCSVRYTSGTTGPAKAVTCSHRQTAVRATHFNWLMYATQQDTLYTTFPLHHTLASMMGVIPMLLVGGTSVIDNRFSASRFWDNLRRSEATLAHMINPMTQVLLTPPPSTSDRDHQCRDMWAGTNTEFEQRFGIRLHRHYGMTEGNVIAYPARDGTTREGSVGRVSPLFDVRICDDKDRQIPFGQEGEIQWRPKQSHLMTNGYLGDPAATVKAWRGLWFHTGDLGRLDEDGYLYFGGRRGDQIRRKGVNIPAEHIEDAAMTFDGVSEAAAIAVPAAIGESEVKLCLVTTGEPDLTGLMAHLRSKLPKEMVPRYVEFRDSLPYTDTHKVRKVQLREEGESGLTAATIDVERLEHGAGRL